MLTRQNRRSWIALGLSWCVFINTYLCCLHHAAMVAPSPDAVAVAFCSLTEQAPVLVALGDGEHGHAQVPMLAPDCPLCSSGVSFVALDPGWHLPPAPGWHPPIHPSSALPLISQPPHWPPASPRASPVIT